MSIYYECDICAKRFDYPEEKLSVVTFTNLEGFKECEFDLCIKCYEEFKNSF